MKPLEDTLYTAAHVLQNAALETVWPTRCAICDQPGVLLCDACAMQLPYIDHNLACPSCGAPFGSIQCTECNTYTLARSGYGAIPLDSCSSALHFDAASKAIVTTFKDKGERRLSGVMAGLMVPLLNPSWLYGLEAITYIPATSKALRRRGFDHGYLLAQALGEQAGLPALGLLSRPLAMDQRELGRRDRAINMRNAITVNPKAKGRMPKRILLVDDVMTTGATLFAAADALKHSGAEVVRGVSFARV